MRKISGSAIWLIAPAFFVVTTIIGAVRWFSTVPFWDMWDGTLQFYIERLQGNRWAPFFEQANEHRIVLSKILFWIDYRFFGGLSEFLVAVNVALMFALWAALCWAAMLLLERRMAWLCAALMCIPCFSWLQAENINWGYQSQFYLAYLLPLLALISMGRWIREPVESRFVIAVLLGVLSAGTMANGLFALPLLVIMLGLSGRSSWPRMSALLFITALTFGAWAYHYQIQHRPGATLLMRVEFLLTFIGGTFSFVFHQGYLTALMGAAAIGAGGYAGVRWVRGERDPIFLALVMFVAHVGAAAVAAAYGRAYFGLSWALAGRYETPVLLMYSALLLIFVHLFRSSVSTRAVVATLSVVTPIILFTPQMGAFDPAGPARATGRMQIALGLNLGVKDDAQAGQLYLPERVYPETADAIRYGLSVFATPLMRNAREAIGKTPDALGLYACPSFIDTTAAVATDSRYMAVDGWAFDDRRKTVPPTIFLVANGVVSGAALTGGERPDVEKAVNPKAVNAGFSGYALKSDRSALSIYCPQ
jgi:hypothetical protein